MIRAHFTIRLGGTSLPASAAQSVDDIDAHLHEALNASPTG